MDNMIRLLAEAVGTCCVCLLAILAAAGVGTGEAGWIVAALAYGLAVTGAMQACGGPAPVHVNPAVTLAVFTAGRGGAARGLCRLVGQVLGAGLAGLLAMWLLAGAGTAMGMPAGSFTRTDAARTMVVEGLLAFLWGAAYLGAVHGRSAAGAAVAVGATVAGGALAAAAFTGGSMNPARALAAAVAAIDFSTLWMYAAAPLAGGALAGLAGRLFLPPERPEIDSASRA
jgi:glycerol uptake facilitator-like aquaporin